MIMRPEHRVTWNHEEDEFLKFAIKYKKNNLDSTVSATGTRSRKQSMKNPTKNTLELPNNAVKDGLTTLMNPLSKSNGLNSRIASF